ncbi:MAG: hypothetical protein KatS3mg123_0347 [Burkholderiales bacterium]|nr:MAG: hypothetical protein KatS3mg123_0347 [Burkholderiales bacterium]
MGAPDQVRVPGVGIGAFQASLDTATPELGGDRPGPLPAPGPQAGQTGRKLGVGRIDPQAHHVDGLGAPGDRHLDALNQGDPPGPGSLPRRGKPSQLVVIGQRQHLHSPCGRPAYHLGGRQYAVRSRGVAMEIDGGHGNGKRKGHHNKTAQGPKPAFPPSTVTLRPGSRADWMRPPGFSSRIMGTGTPSGCRLCLPPCPAFPGLARPEPASGLG